MDKLTICTQIENQLNDVGKLKATNGVDGNETQ